MKLPIITVPHATLNTPANPMPVEYIVDPKIQELIANLRETMYAAEGVGIAAPQVNILERVCIIGKEATPNKETDIVLINPTLERISRSTNTDTEGCLSIPKIYGEVKRPKDIRVHALDGEGNSISFDAHDFFARVIQHEVDHLDGILFVERAKHLYRLTEKKESIPVTKEDIFL
jgi:peptide deformylase